MFNVDNHQCFYGALIRGPKEHVDKYIEKHLKNAYIIEKKDIGKNEILVRLNCNGYQIECQSEEEKDLAIVIFTTLGAYASLFAKKAGETELREYELGEMDSDNDYLQIYNECPDKVIHEKYILSNCGEGVEFKYEPSEYVTSMISDDKISADANLEPKALCEYLEEYDEELDMEGYIVLK